MGVNKKNTYLNDDVTPQMRAAKKIGMPLFINHGLN
ncbi:hypothetical protein PAECIP111802_03128 [Paenibacillus allorhizosphaerae]|uniref:Uncharacterized protein n=1 Tax=Paenibacillus allorhizosphaerae TaxID=2849866 RepID=A0ABM8VIC9_9BACL|nr:hypothetical protein PAECIP111802_03128 [Paenibacillus allorhizosphaerae]